MEAESPRGPDLITRSSPRRRLLKVALTALLAIAALFLIQLASSAIHHALTPDFRTYTQAHPVDEHAWHARLDPAGEELGRGDSFSLGAAPGAEGTSTARAVLGATFEHGPTSLADVQVALDIVVHPVPREEGGSLFDIDGIQASILSQTCDPDFHPVVVVSLKDRGSYSTETSSAQDGYGQSSIVVDTYLLSGPGSALLVAREANESWNTGEMPDELTMPGLPLLLLRRFGAAFSAPPEEGLVYRVRTGLYPGWHNDGDGGRGGPGLTPIRLAANTTEYSIKLTGKTGANDPWDEPGSFKSGLSTTTTADIATTWAGEVW